MTKSSTFFTEFYAVSTNLAYSLSVSNNYARAAEIGLAQKKYLEKYFENYEDMEIYAETLTSLAISAANLKDIKKAAQYANKTIAVCKAILAAGDGKTDQAIVEASLKKCGDILDAL